jgi:polyisoprenoid-binding protein YceI
MVAKARHVATRASRCVVLAAFAILAGCRSTTTPQAAANASQSQSVESTATTTRADTRRLEIDPERTVITVVVRRAGPLAKLGHDHVLTSADEAGSVWLGNLPADSSFELTLPVERFDVDLPAARAAAGPEFAAPVPDDARAGTRQNMLRAEVLDLEHFPTITLRSTASSGVWPQPNVRVAVTLKGVQREQEIAVVVERDADSLLARGELRLNQTDFGITPFSVAGGALRVADTLEIRFELAAASSGALSLSPVP